MTRELRQLFHPLNMVTKEGSFPVTEDRSAPQGDDLSYEAWAAFRNKQKQTAGAMNAPRSSSKSGGSKSKPQKGAREKMDLIGALGNATGVTAVEANTTFYPNVQLSRSLKPLFRRTSRPRIRDRPSPLSP